MSASIKLIHGIEPQENDVISKPSHYVAGRKIEPIEAIEDWKLNHHLACAVKYITRAGRKNDEVKDLKKALWYLERWIRVLTTAKSEKVE